MGSRTIKTCLALFITLLITTFLQLDIFLAGIASLSAMQQTVYKSFQHTKNHLGANVFAGIYAIIIGLIFPINIIVITFAILFFIFIINKFKILNYNWIPIGYVIILAVLTVEADTKSSYIILAIGRIISIFVGISISAIINLLIKTPDVKKFIILEMDNYMLLAKKINSHKEIIDQINFDLEIDELEESLMTIKQLRVDYENESTIKYSKVDKNIHKEKIIQLSFNSFIDLHNLLISLKRYYMMDSYNSTIELKTNHDFTQLINYHQELIHTIFTSTSSIKSTSFVNIKTIKTSYLEDFYLSKSNEKNLHLVGFFLEYCDNLSSIEELSKKIRN